MDPQLFPGGIWQLPELLFGILAGAAWLLLVRHARKRRLAVPWWGWVLSFGLILHSSMTLVLVWNFVLAGSGKVAFLLGAALTAIAIVWGRLIARFVYRPLRHR